MLAAETLDLLRTAAAAAADKTAFQLVCFEVGDLTSYADAFLLCSAASDRQVGAVVDAVVARLKRDGRTPLHVEGDGGGGWVLIDYGDVIVHVFTEERRGYYALDSLWGDAPRVDADDLGLAGADDE
jgi:ribosome-associated protein